MEISGKDPSVANLEVYSKNVGNSNKIDDSSSRGTKEAAGEVTREDKVVLSPRAREIQEAKKLLDSMPEIREEKVAQIKKQIEAGTYVIDEKKVASKMVEELLLNELL